jgi:hypothetical protein
MKYGMTRMVDPEMNYDQLVSKFGLFPFLTCGKDDAVQFEILNPPASRISITIDLDKVNSLGALKDHISYLLQRLYNTGMIKIGSKKYRKAYADILKVGDVKAKTKISDEAIAAELFPDDCEKSYSTATKKVNILVNQYDYFVKKGGWKELTYP